MATVLLTSNYRPEYRRAGILAHEAKAGTVMVFSYQPRHIAPDVSLCVGDEVSICMQVVDAPDDIYQVQTANIIGLTYDKDRLFITLKMLSEHPMPSVDELADDEDRRFAIDGRGYVVFDHTMTYNRHIHG